MTSSLSASASFGKITETEPFFFGLTFRSTSTARRIVFGLYTVCFPLGEPKVRLRLPLRSPSPELSSADSRSRNSMRYRADTHGAACYVHARCTRRVSNATYLPLAHLAATMSRENINAPFLRRKYLFVLVVCR